MKKKTEPENSAATVQLDSTLSKGLLILQTLAQTDGGMGVTDLSRALAMTKSNAFRLLRTLTALGYVKNSADKLYSPTMKVWMLGQDVVSHLPLPEIAAPYLRMLSKQTGETIYLAVPDGLSVVYVDKIECTQPIRTWTPKGGSAPMHCVATGKALLASKYESLRHLIRNHLTRFTDKTITTLTRLDAEMAETRERGYAIDVGEYRNQTYSIGAAVTLPDGDAIAAIGVSVPSFNLTEGRLERIGADVMLVANAMSNALAES